MKLSEKLEMYSNRIFNGVFPEATSVRKLAHEAAALELENERMKSEIAALKAMHRKVKSVFRAYDDVLGEDEP